MEGVETHKPKGEADSFDSQMCLVGGAKKNSQNHPAKTPPPRTSATATAMWYQKSGELVGGPSSDELRGKARIK